MKALPSVKNLAGLALIGDGLRRLVSNVNADNGKETGWFAALIPNRSGSEKAVGYGLALVEIAGGLATIFLIKK